jgi:hypothetical protein
MGMSKQMTPMQRKLALLSADMLPYLGTAIGAAATGGAGGPIGGAIGGMASEGIKAFIPPEQQMQQQQGMMTDRPMVVGGQGGGTIDLDQQQQQQMFMNQLMQGHDPMQGLGQGLGALTGAGLTGLLSLLGGGGNDAAKRSMFGKMDAGDGLREKLVRMVALKQALGQ